MTILLGTCHCLILLALPQQKSDILKEMKRTHEDVKWEHKIIHNELSLQSISFYWKHNGGEPTD